MARALSPNVTTNAARGTSMQAREIVLALLLTASMFINYIDRSNLSIAAPILQRDLALSTAQIGILSSAFFWTYSLFQLLGISGWLCDHFPVAVVFAVSTFLWGASTIATGLLSAFSAIFAMRLVLGAGESFAYPCYSRIIASEVPQHFRGRANALLDAASKLGPALGMLAGGMLLVHFSWRAFFIVLGCVSLAWLIPWYQFTLRGQSRHTFTAGAQGSIRSALRNRSSWGTFAGHFCGNYVWFFVLIWLPTYLVNERGMSIGEMTTAGSAACFVIASGTLCAGWMSDRFISHGRSATVVRKSVVVGGLLGSASMALVGYLPGRASSMALLMGACFAFGTYTSNHWAITQTLAGPALAGRWTGIQNGIGNFSGIVTSWLTGEIVMRTGSFRGAFVVTALVAVAGACMWGLVVGPVRELSSKEAAG